MDWSGKRVVILGAARQGTVLARYLAEKGASVLVNDQRQEGLLKDVIEQLDDLSLEWVLGGHPSEVLDGADLVCLSGGVPLYLPLAQEALRRGIPLSNDSQIFLESTPCRTVGITGSAGKTTTTTLVGRMAEAAIQSKESGLHPRRVWVGGNIGSPLLSVIDEMQADDLAVMELSSFQLELMDRSPQVAAVLNITPNHLDRHMTMEAYTNCKQRILAYQGPGQAAVLGCDDPGAWKLAKTAPGRVWSFGSELDQEIAVGGSYTQDGEVCLWDGVRESALLSWREVSLRGEHNRMNVLAACAIAGAVGLPHDAVRKGVEGFRGVPHRLEFLREWKGAQWYNDSIATAPERSMAAIRSFDQSIVLLAGGRDKDLPWDTFSNLVHERVDHLILFGEASEKIARAVGKVKPGETLSTVAVCRTLKDAVLAAAAVVEAGDVVLFSPGGTSFDEFRDFEERGEVYRKWVQAL